LIKDLGYHVLKTYDSSLSSDGSTLNEFLAAFCIGAECDATSKTIGSFYQGEKLQGIVQEIIPQNFKKLGNVPNFKTITRDTFGNHIALTNEFIKNVLRDVSYSCKYVFSKGVSHGDIYAHNVLANQTGNAKLIDWGAACMFDPNASEASKREKIEVRAFGYLIDDLLQLQPTKDENLYAIKNACLNLKASHRPSFKEISELLNKL
jgi:serine/threonine protein kinase